LRDLRTAIDALTAAAGNDALTPATVAAIEAATAHAVARMEQATTDVVSRVERRDEEIVRHTDGLAASMDRSVQSVQKALQDVVAGLAASDRFVRSRFT